LSCDVHFPVLESFLRLFSEDSPKVNKSVELLHTSQH